jgi:carotenoid cleavage dioxygenase-like enzyme
MFPTVLKLVVSAGVLFSVALAHDVDFGYGALFENSLEETLAPVELSGSVPDWLTGTFLRNGPGRFDGPNGPKRNFTFAWDGYSKVQKYTFKDGKVSYQTRFLGNKWYNKSREINDIAPTLLFGTTVPPEKMSLKALMSKMNSQNVNIWRFGNESSSEERPVYTATTDIAEVARFEPEHLSGMPFEWADKLILKINSAAHPQYLVGDNSVTINYAATPSMLGFNTTIDIYKVTGNGMKRETIGTISMKTLPLIHSFGITDNFAVFTLWPIRWHMGCLMKFLPIAQCMVWDNSARSIIALVPLDGSNKIKYFDGEPTMAWHHINSYETKDAKTGDDLVVVDVNSCKSCGSASAMSNMQLGIIRNKALRDKELSHTADPTIRRYTLNLKTGKTVSERDFGRKGEDGLWYNTSLLPRINDKYRGKKYCYVYLETAANAGSSPDYADMALVKKDVCTDAPLKVWHVDFHYPSEPQFVPNPSGATEDDGVLLSVVLDGKAKKSYLLTLDAKTFKEISRVYIPFIQPTGLHGQYYEDL